MYLTIIGLFKIVFLHIILTRMTSFPKFFARCQHFINTCLSFSLNNSNSQLKKQSHNFESSFVDATKKNVDDGLSREEIEVVMERLGLFCHSEEGEFLQERLFTADITNLFEEKEASFDEVKATFDVFDENRDGFIDAKDLQRVLCTLGLKEQSEIEDCRRMIRLHDNNGDGKIDLDEFAEFLEKSFC